jgi:hypothetical protein
MAESTVAAPEVQKSTTTESTQGHLVFGRVVDRAQQRSDKAF